MEDKMAKIISGCCGEEVIEKYGIKICTGCGPFPCSEREVSECCEAEIKVHQPDPPYHPEASPADPIEYCDECGRRVR